MSDKVTVQEQSSTVVVEERSSNVLVTAVESNVTVQTGENRVAVQEALSQVTVQTDAPIEVRVVGPPASTATAVGGSVPQKSNKDESPLSSSGDESPTGITISVTPTGASPYVGAIVNGVSYTVGGGVKTEHAYFSSDGGVTARLFGAIVAGDELIWNGVIAGFDLLNSRDKVNLDYDT